MINQNHTLVTIDIKCEPIHASASQIVNKHDQVPTMSYDGVRISYMHPLSAVVKGTMYSLLLLFRSLSVGLYFLISCCLRTCTRNNYYVVSLRTAEEIKVLMVFCSKTYAT